MRYINIHVLIAHSASCLNRDDMQMQKTAMLGGVRRTRVSSQSLKYWMRHSDYYQSEVGEKSIRTREYSELKSRFLEKAKLDGNDIDELALDSVMDILCPTDAKPAVAAFTLYEIRKAYEIFQEMPSKSIKIAQDLIKLKQRKGKVSEELKDKNISKEKKEELDKENKKIEPQIKTLQTERTKIEKKIKEGLNKSPAPADIALSGRFIANKGWGLSSMDAAMSIAHSITTHSTDTEIDWFTATDDLVEEGAAHLQGAEFSSGTFYRYASINTELLAENLDKDSDQAMELCGHVAYMLATISPGAKASTYGQHDLASYQMIVRSDIPISLSGAFEKPVTTKGGYMEPSIEALENFWVKQNQAYGLKEKAIVFSPHYGTKLGTNSKDNSISTSDSIAGVMEWIK